MATMEHFHREVAAGAAMLQAGNIQAAIRHCKAAFEIAPDHLDVYELQIDILRHEERRDEALRWTQRRLEHTPDCRWTHLQNIRLQSELGRSGLAKKARDQAIGLFSDDPMMVHDAHFMFDAVLGRDRAVLKRLKQVRRDGYWGVFDLRKLEQSARAGSGHLYSLGKLQQEDLEDGFIDAETLHSQAVVRFLQGRLLSARTLASQSIDRDPANRPIYAETRLAATLGLIPFFWGAQLFITLTGSITARLPWFIRIFINYGFAILCLILVGLILSPIGMIPGVPDAVSDTVIGILGFANVGWALYVIWAFGSFGRWRARKRSVGLSKDY